MLGRHPNGQTGQGEKRLAGKTRPASSNGSYAARPVATEVLPNCCINPSASQLFQLSTNFPSCNRPTVIPVTEKVLPVAGIVGRSPLCVPLTVQRVTAVLPS